MLLGPSEQEVTHIFHALVRHFFAMGWEIGPMKIKGYATFVRFLASNELGHVGLPSIKRKISC